MQGPRIAGAANFEKHYYALKGWVYFVRVGDEVKVGCTTRIPRRFVEAAKERKAPATVLACVPGSFRLEREIHEWLTPWGTNGARGDWFHATEDLLAWAATLGGPFVGETFHIPRVR